MSLYSVAKEARANAYAPYSNFKVGAAIRSTDGRIFTGCNVENVAYPEGTCAEAGAIAAMVAAGGKGIAEILVIADAAEPVTPCGGCRQKIAEFAKPGVPVTLADLEGPRVTMSVEDLLPGAFTAKHMDRSDG